MRYLLIDRIHEWKAGEKIRGVKNIAMSEDFLEFHFPGRPVMPGVLLIEAFVQLTGWLEAASSDFKNWFLMTAVHQCKFHGFVFPGDQVELEIHPLPESGPDRRIYSGIGKVGGKKKVTVEFGGELIAFEDLEDRDEQRKFFRVLTREG